MRKSNVESSEAEADRIAARKRAERESLRAATSQARSMTSDFNAAFGVPSLFAAGTAITKAR